MSPFLAIAGLERKKVKEDLPDIKYAKVARAKLRILRDFKGYKARKRVQSSGRLTRSKVC